MRNLPAALIAALVLGIGPTARAADVVAPPDVAMTQSVVTLSAGVDATVADDTHRKYLCLMNIGTGLVTLGFGQAAVAGAGWALEPAASAGHQGGSMCWEDNAITDSVVHAVSAAGSTLVVLEAK